LKWSCWASPKGDAFEVLEPYDGKLSCTVLRGVWAGNRLNLPDILRSKGVRCK